MEISSKSVETHQNVFLSLNPNCKLYEEKLKAFEMRLNYIYISIRISSKIIKMKKGFLFHSRFFNPILNFFQPCPRLTVQLENKIKIGSQISQNQNPCSHFYNTEKFRY